MGDLYLAAAERVTYKGLLYSTPGRICGEIPDLYLAASGLSEPEVKATLQGLLEEIIDSMMEDQEPLPEPEFQTVSDSDVLLGTEATGLRTLDFTVVLPSTVSKSMLASMPGLSTVCIPPKLKQLRYNAVILRTYNSFGAHFPDLPGAFTSAESVEEACSKLQALLEFYMGRLVKNGLAVPEPKFTQLSDLTEQDLQETPPVCIIGCSIELPA